MVDRRLYQHLVSRFGQWPPRQPVQVVASARRTRPGWDGRLRPAIALAAPAGAVVSVPPEHLATVRRLAGRLGDGPAGAREQLDGLLAALPAAIGHPDCGQDRGTFRWTLAPAPLEPAGQWCPPAAAGLPSWLRWYGEDVLVVRDDDGRYLAGAGIKRHDAYGAEIAVGTVEAARGQGLARRLVAEAARRALDEGLVPTYVHDPGDAAAARVGDAAGMAERGWRLYTLVPE
ncbi:GNAT family N-acetyltransferase [Melissospora conviva]|uniref:GNAT family N-acetyltransferase n=1 Tax=Melissospora conviva TaxID=3388432 RepID=UPI003C2A7759